MPNLKSLPGLRSTIGRLRAAKHGAGVAAHRFLAVTNPGSRVLGSPKRFLPELSQRREPGIDSGSGWEETLLMGGSETVAPSVAVLGTPPAGYSNAPLTFPIRETMTVLQPGRIFTDALAVITSDDSLAGHISAYYGEGYAHPAFTTLRLPEPKILPGRGLYLVGYDNYFHYVTDLVPRFRLLEMAGIRLDSFDYFLLHKPKYPFEKELLDQFGIPADKIVDPWDFRHVQVEEMVIPAVHNREGHWFVEYLRSRLLKPDSAGSDAAGKRRLYLSRRKAGGRRVRNEEEVFALLEKHGFEFIETEKFTAMQQAALFHEAEYVAGAHGAGLTNVLFCHPGATLLELRGTTHFGHTDDCYRKLCAYGDIKHALLFCDASSDNPAAHGYDFDLTVSLPLLEEMLQRTLPKPGETGNPAR